MTKETIFVSIPAVEDTEIFETISCAINSASDSSRIHFGVHLLDMNKKNLKKITKLKKIHPNISVSYSKLVKNSLDLLGTGIGRTMAMSHYSDQDYVLQIDAHTWLDYDWDTYLINIFKRAKEEIKKDKIVITKIPGFFRYSDYGVKEVWEDVRMHPYTSFRKMELYSQAVPKWDQFPFNNKEESFYPASKINTACIFGDKQFALTPQIDPNAIYYDEEVTQSIGLYGKGFSFVYPNVDDFPVFHLNANTINKFGGKRIFFTDLLSAENKRFIDLKIAKSYKDFINAQENLDAVAAYEKYANIFAKYGGKELCYIPPKYRHED